MAVFWIGITFLFYFLEILQGGFFANFMLFGTVPNLIFIFFFVLAFFEAKEISWKLVAYSALAGVFMDIFYNTPFGVCGLILFLSGAFAKQAQILLQETEEKYPVHYFIPLFLVSFIIYKILFAFYARYFGHSQALLQFDWRILADIIYNSVFALAGFYLYKKFFK